ncbi:hypothetical protein BJX63DRAFT_401688 [Aspergillus granulosus]|uniref:Uncharacterized protein n=1 Tax=Aspergillus granulosus TaxID=176169 RepID=A0ABR4H5V3_9EURO
MLPACVLSGARSRVGGPSVSLGESRSRDLVAWAQTFPPSARDPPAELTPSTSHGYKTGYSFNERYH